MNELVSVIVSVYNIEAYLPRCLESLKAQSYTNLEIILVDDGSTDSSGKICDEYAVSDSRARVIHHDHNIGLWAARNTGQDAATGEYLWFPDGDDYFHRDIVKVMYEAINRSCRDGKKFDMAIVSYMMTCRLDEDTSFAVTPSIREESINELFGHIVRPSREMSVFAMWGKFFRKGLLNGIHSESYKYAQDRDFSIKVLLKEPRVVIVDNKLYYWTQRPSSARFQADYPLVRALCETRLTYKNYLSLDGQTHKYGPFLLDSLYCRIADCFDLIGNIGDDIQVKQELQDIVRHTWKAYLGSKCSKSLPKRIKRLVRVKFNGFYNLYKRIYVAGA